jgi:hypothetical protein
MRTWIVTTSIIACLPFGWGLAEFLDPNGNLHTAASCFLFATVVALLGLWGPYLAGKE